MSVNMHLPSSASYRGQPYGHHPRAPRAAAKTEDAQPNELLSRRNISGPPVVRPSAPLPRFRGRSAGRGTKPYVNTKRHVPPLPGFKSMRTDAHGNRDMTPLSATHSESQSGPHRQGSRRRDSDATRGDARSGASSSNPKDKLTIWTPMPRTERLQWTTQGALPTTRTRDGPSTDYHGESASGAGARRDIVAPAVALPRSRPPLPRPHLMYFRTRELSPDLSLPTRQTGKTRTNSLGEARRKKSRTDVAQPGPSGLSSRAVESRSERDQQEQGPATQSASRALALASDLLLSDLNQSVSSTFLGGQASRDFPPPAKRRKVSSPPVAPPYRSSLTTTSTAPAPEACVVAPVAASDSRPIFPPAQSQEGVTATSPAVKRERSPSPGIGDDTTPRLVTEGCVRIAPVPPECRSGRTGYQAARKEWTAREAAKLRQRGLLPTRVLVREDGMVIDWKSKVPVMSDTLRPPPVGNEVELAESMERSARELCSVKKAKPPDTSTDPSDTTTTQLQPQDRPPEHPADLPSLPEGEPRPPLAPRSWGQPHPPRAPRSWFTPAVPGQTIWSRPSTNTSPPSLAREEDIPPGKVSVQAEPVQDHTGVPAATAQRSALPTAHQGPDRVNADIPPGVQVIDVTGGPDNTAGWSAASSVPQCLADATSRTHTRSSQETHQISQAGPSSSKTPAAQPAGSDDPSVAVIDDDLTYQMKREEMHAAAIDYLKRYLSTFMLDRAELASAYSRAATFSVQVLPPSFTSAIARVSKPSNVLRPSTHHCGRVDIIAALLDLPDDQLLFSVRSEGSGAQKCQIDWDVLYAREAGDVLLTCYATAPIPAVQEADWSRKSKGKGKEKAVDGGARTEASHDGPIVGACLQHFILRNKEWDEEDRSTPGVWPMVAVAHHILFTPLLP